MSTKGILQFAFWYWKKRIHKKFLEFRLLLLGKCIPRMFKNNSKFWSKNKHCCYHCIQGLKMSPQGATNATWHAWLKPDKQAGQALVTCFWLSSGVSSPGLSKSPTNPNPNLPLPLPSIVKRRRLSECIPHPWQITSRRNWARAPAFHFEKTDCAARYCEFFYVSSYLFLIKYVPKNCKFLLYLQISHSEINSPAWHEFHPSPVETSRRCLDMSRQISLYSEFSDPNSA